MRTPDAAAQMALAHAPYRKSSRSTGTGSCVLVGAASGWVGIQDSKEHPDSTRRTTLATPHQHWATFLLAVKNGQLSLGLTSVERGTRPSRGESHVKRGP